MNHISSTRRSCALAAALSVVAIAAIPAQQSHSAKAGGSPGGQSQRAEVRTEKIKFKQEFGPAAVGRRGDLSNAAGQPGAGNANHGSSSSASQFKQEFGPQVAARRGDRMTAATPPASSGGNSQAPTAANAAQPTKKTPAPTNQTKPQ